MRCARKTAIDATEALRAAKTKNVTVGVGYNWRFQPALQEVRRMLEDGRLGKLLHLEGNFCGPSVYRFPKNHWRQERGEGPAGGMTGRGVHTLDAYLYHAGPVATVHAQSVRRSVTLTIKGQGDPMALAPLVRRELAAIDPELPLYSVMSMRERMDQSLVDRRTPMLLALMFAGVALFLAALGIYGVLAYQVSQRQREIGIRIALGSDAARIFRMVLAEGMVLLGLGFAAGLALAVAIRGALQSQLYGIGALDPLALRAVALVLGLVAIVACLVPARRASRIDPVVALGG
jgi:hypothetical protein